VSDDREAAAFFAQVSADLMEEGDEEVTFERVAQRAVEVVAPCDDVGILLRRRRGRTESVAATSSRAKECDLLQQELGEGPCLEAIWDSESYLVPDTRSDPRWPRWGPRVAERGVGSVLSIRLATGKETLGSLNLYASRSESYTDEDVDTAVIFAMHATNAMSSAKLISGLQTAAQNRHLIGVAQGILMHRYHLTMEQAFEVLRRYSSHLNVKVRDLASEVVERGALPDAPAGPGDQAGARQQPLS
jgi:GAF domain-containing protein